MNALIVIDCVLAVLLALLAFVLRSPRCRGWLGEKLVSLLLKRLDPQLYRVLNNVYLPKPDGTTTQIDHVVVSPFGVFVVETKTYQGWIFCGADSKVWTQCIRKKGFRAPIKNTFQNPLHQNYAHLCAIEQCTGIPKDVMRSVVAFAGGVTFKTERPAGVCYFIEVAKYVKSFTTPIIKDEQLDEIESAILEWQATLTRKQKSSHVKNLKSRREGASLNGPSPLCPRCGAQMVLRARKSDGQPFYGCSEYPKCKGVVKVQEAE